MGQCLALWARDSWPAWPSQHHQVSCLGSCSLEDWGSDVWGGVGMGCISPASGGGRRKRKTPSFNTPPATPCFKCSTLECSEASLLGQLPGMIFPAKATPWSGCSNLCATFWPVVLNDSRHGPSSVSTSLCLEDDQLVLPQGFCRNECDMESELFNGLFPRTCKTGKRVPESVPPRLPTFHGFFFALIEIDQPLLSRIRVFLQVASVNIDIRPWTMASRCLGFDHFSVPLLTNSHASPSSLSSRTRRVWRFCLMDGREETKGERRETLDLLVLLSQRLSGLML